MRIVVRELKAMVGLVDAGGIQPDTGKPAPSRSHHRALTARAATPPTVSGKKRTAATPEDIIPLDNEAFTDF
jgi:hypothetical protein